MDVSLLWVFCVVR